MAKAKIANIQRIKAWIKVLNLKPGQTIDRESLTDKCQLELGMSEKTAKNYVDLILKDYYKKQKESIVEK